MQLHQRAESWSDHGFTVGAAHSVQMQVEQLLRIDQRREMRRIGNASYESAKRKVRECRYGNCEPTAARTFPSCEWFAQERLLRPGICTSSGRSWEERPMATN